MSIAITRETILRLAELAGIKIAREHRAGVIRNLEILLEQAAVLERVPLDPSVEPAAEFRASTYRADDEESS